MEIDTDSHVKYLENVGKGEQIYPIPYHDIFPAEFITKLCRGDLDKDPITGKYDEELCKRKLKDFQSWSERFTDERCKAWLIKINHALTTWVINFNVTRLSAIVNKFGTQAYIDALRGFNRTIRIPVLDTEGYRVACEVAGARKACQMVQDKCGYECNVMNNNDGTYYVEIIMMI